MDKFTKRFWRDLLTTGLPFGLAWAVYASIDYGWKTGSFLGLVTGSLFGLFFAFYNGRNLSKPTYRLQLNPAPLTVTKTEFVFRPLDLSFARIFLFFGVYVLAAIFAIQMPYETGVLKFLFLTVVGMALLVFWLVHTSTTRLTISAKGIEYQSFLVGTQRAAWNDMARIERRADNWLIVCNAWEINRLNLVASWIRIDELDNMIGLRDFTANFTESDIARAIFHYKPQIEVLTTI